MINNRINEEIKWKGFKEARVFKIVKEDMNVKSFYLNFADGSKMPKFKAGQFIAVRIKNEDGSYTKTRQYTLSLNHREDFYRISVKREAEGFLSKKLCDEVKEGDSIEITIPMGKFILKESDKPVILIGGGIGITPMLTMAHEAIKGMRNIHFIYSIPNLKNHSFKEEIESLAENNELKKTIFYTKPLDNEEPGNDYVLKGRITKEWISENLPNDGEFYFCGPIPFMKNIYESLISMGVKREQINYEMFGSGADITK